MVESCKDAHKKARNLLFFFFFFYIILVFNLFVLLYLRFSRHLIFGIAKQLMNFNHVSPFCLSWLMPILFYLVYNSQMLFLIPVSFWSIYLVIDLIFNFQNRSSWWIYTTRWPQRRGVGRMWEGDNYQIDTGTGEHNYLNSPRIYLQKHSPRRWSWMMAWRSEEAMLSVGQFMVGNSLHGQVVDQIITGWQRNRTDIPSRSQQLVVPIATRAHK